MAVGMSAATADGVLSAVFQGTSFVVSALWVKLHVGDPGGAGTSNAAGETLRMNASACFGTAPADDGSGMKEAIANTVAIGPWTSVTTAETYSHVSFWTASSGGSFVGSGTLTSPTAVAIGDNFTVQIGDCVAKLSKAA